MSTPTRIPQPPAPARKVNIQPGPPSWYGGRTQPAPVSPAPAEQRNPNAETSVTFVVEPLDGPKPTEVMDKPDLAEVGRQQLPMPQQRPAQRACLPAAKVDTPAAEHHPVRPDSRRRRPEQPAPEAPAVDQQPRKRRKHGFWAGVFVGVVGTAVWVIALTVVMAQVS